MSVANEITRLREAKDDLKTSINAKNAPNNQITNETIDGYASFVDLIPKGGITPTGTINITSNGTHDVTNYASADVNVPTGITPTGTLNITANGNYDVTTYANANVDVKNGSSTAPYILDSVSWSGRITTNSSGTSTYIYVSPTATEITTRTRYGRTEYVVPNGSYFIMITGQVVDYSTDVSTQILFTPAGGTQLNYIAKNGQIRFLSEAFTINLSSEKEIKGSARDHQADVTYTLYRLNDTYHT